jgi:hypothetical protein
MLWANLIASILAAVGVIAKSLACKVLLVAGGARQCGHRFRLACCSGGPRTQTIGALASERSSQRPTSVPLDWATPHAPNQKHAR